MSPQGIILGLLLGAIITGLLTYRMCIRCQQGTPCSENVLRMLRHGSGYVPQEAVLRVIEEIEAEIQARPQYSNMGKKGCVKRLRELVRPDRLYIYNGGK